MKCPQCSQELLIIADKFLLCPNHGQIGMVEMHQEVSSTTTERQDIQRLVLERFPFPIAYGYRRVVHPESAASAVKYCFYTYEASLRFGALVFVSQFLLPSSAQNPQAAQQLRSPTLWNWVTVFSALGQRLFPPLLGKTLSFAPFSKGGPFVPGLAVAARKLAKLELNGMQVAEHIRKLRNTHAHDIPWDEAECAKRLPELRSLVEVVLELFADMAEIELLRRSPSGMVRLAGYKDTFTEEEIPEPLMEELFDESETLLRNAAGDLLPLYPLFLGKEETLQGYSEPLLVFAGHGQKTCFYLGVRSISEREDTLTRYQDLLRDKNIDPGFTKREMTPWSVTEWARETSLGVIDNLRGVKYFPAFYQERCTDSTQKIPTDPDDPEATEWTGGGVDDMLRRWLDRGREAALIVAAEAGAGKTSLFCRLAEELLRPVESKETSDCVLLLLGSSFRGASLFERIREGLGFLGDSKQGGIVRFDELLRAWIDTGQHSDVDYEKRRLVLLIDAVNEAQDPKRLFEELSDLAATATRFNHKRKHPWVRLGVSVRAMRIETLLDRWQERSDTPFLANPQNFAKFLDERGKEVPYLSLRRFKPDEAMLTWNNAQAALGSSCPAAWNDLASATHELLRHPLLLYLFHGAFANVKHPPAVTAANALWSAYLDRTFHPDQGGRMLEKWALDLADACIDGGYSIPPDELATEWRSRWQAEQGNDPIRIAANLDPIERLTEAGLLRHGETTKIVWVSDSLAEQVFFRALRRRDPSLMEESLKQWRALIPTPILDGALVNVGVTCLKQGRGSVLKILIDNNNERWFDMDQIFIQVAPCGQANKVWKDIDFIIKTISDVIIKTISDRLNSEIGFLYQIKILLKSAIDELQNRLGAIRVITHYVELATFITEFLVKNYSGEKIFLMKELADLYDSAGDIMKKRWMFIKARELYEKSLALREELVVLNPNDTDFLIALIVSYKNIGRIEKNPIKAKEWLEKSLVLIEKLIAQDPSNTHYLFGLSISYGEMGWVTYQNDSTYSTQAINWYEKYLDIAEKIIEIEQNCTFLHNLCLSYYSMGSINEQHDPAKAIDWYEKSLKIAENLVTLERDNIIFLDALSLLYKSIGQLTNNKELYKKSLVLLEKLVAFEPDNIDFLDNLLDWYNTRGDMYESHESAKAIECYKKAFEIHKKIKQLMPDKTHELYEKAIDIAKKLEVFEPNNIQILLDLLLLYNKRTDIKDSSKTRSWCKNAIKIAEKLTTLEPNNTLFLYDLSISYARMGDMQRNMARSRKWYEKSLLIREKIVELESDSTLIPTNLLISYERKGGIKKQRNPAKIYEQYDEKGYVLFSGSLPIAYYRIGNINEHCDPEQAKKWYKKAIKIAEHECEYLFPFLRDLLPFLYERMGYINERRDPTKAHEWYEKAAQLELVSSPSAAVRILNGSHQGTVLHLDHARTKLGNSDSAIIRTHCDYIYTVDIFGGRDYLLENHDIIEINGIQIEFYYC